jgi:hypothetical protein
MKYYTGPQTWEGGENCIMSDQIKEDEMGRHVECMGKI